MGSKRKIERGSSLEDDANEPELGRDREPPSKKQQVQQDVDADFRPCLFDAPVHEGYRQFYANSTPFKHCVIPDLINKPLLRAVRDEIQSNVSFTPKETDIYKIHQSGDLANLDGLDASSLESLPSLVQLRNALYSAQFRNYLSSITGAGPLSGIKTDMAVNVYTPGCHLLCHDDVIGSRRVSYILYLTDPDRRWRPEWGGALRLYSTDTMRDADGTEAKVPRPDFEKVIPPAFNQLSFFAVQPGESFHDVEEVYRVGAMDLENTLDDHGRVRMAISGWYHIPQRGEEGFVEGAEERQAENSSLAQLQGKTDKFDLPQPTWIGHADATDRSAGRHEGDNELTEEDLTFLLCFMNPRYLTPDTVSELCETFADDSSLRLAQFLSPKFSDVLRSTIVSQDSERRSNPRTAGWLIARPPYKHRFLFMKPHTVAPQEQDDPHIVLLVSLFPSLAFRKWLSLATGLSLGACNVLARRFRRGLDYSLATNYEEENPRLEACLGITPTLGWGEVDDDDDDDEEGVEDSTAGQTKSKPNARAEDPSVGGYEIYMAGDDNADDNGSDHGVPVESSHTGAGKRKEQKSRNADPAIYDAAAEEDDGVLFSMPAAWNTLSIVLRDQGVLKFVKYVSRAAAGDRWDITGEWRLEHQPDSEEDEVV